METFEENLKNNLLFVKNYEELINSHLVNFITNNLWEKCLPIDLRNSLEKFDKNQNFTEILENCPQLLEIIRKTELLNLKNNSNILELKDIPNILSNNSKSRNNNFFTEKKDNFMKNKKNYEISLFSKIINYLIKDNKTLVIDAGGGKGYLGTYLSENYMIPVLSIDSNPSRNESAINRHKLMEKKKNQSYSLVKYSTNFIDENTNFSQLVKINFPNLENHQYLLTGLHTCGPLAHSLIKTFINSEKLNILFFISCCYHLTNEFLTTKMNFSKNMRMLAQQSIERISVKNGEHSSSIFYRALLQVLLESFGIPDAKIGRGAPKDNFNIYAKWALKKLEINPQNMPSDEDLNNLEKNYLNYKWKINIFQTLRAHIGSVIESSIILDRFIYLQKSKKCSKLYLTRVFDPLLSPRCYAIIAFK